MATIEIDNDLIERLQITLVFVNCHRSDQLALNPHKGMYKIKSGEQRVPYKNTAVCLK